MDNENYEQITLTAEAIGDGAVFLKDGMMVTIQSLRGRGALGGAAGYGDHGDRRGRSGGEGPDRRLLLQAGQARERRPRHGAAASSPPATRIVVNTADGSYVERAKD